MLNFNRCIAFDGTGYPAGRGAGKAGFEAMIVALLFKIDESETGTRLLEFIDKQKHVVVIRPPASDDDIANAGGAWAAPTNNKDAFLAGKRLRQGDGNFYGKSRGTGAGSDVDLPFDPHIAAFNAHDHADHVLIHELTHAARSISGTLRNRPMQGFHTRDEFYGICVENMYAAEHGWQMRSGHGGNSWVTSVSWSMTDPKFDTAMARLHVECPDLVIALARASTSFNPFRQWLLSKGLSGWAGGGARFEAAP